MHIRHRFLWVSGLSLLWTFGTLRLLAAPDMRAALSAPARQATPVTASAAIAPETPLAMGDTGVTLTFAAGAAGAVTVTLVPTMPIAPPPGATLNSSWLVTTTAEDYAVTATFAYSQIVPVDVVVAVDTSGSMEFDTLCYGCWTPTSTLEYPEGNLHPLPWNGPTDGPPLHCGMTATWPYTIGGYVYTLIEAEEYSFTSNSYEQSIQGYTYWVIQRNGTLTDPGTNYLGDAGARGRDAQGAYIAHFPYRTGFADGSSINADQGPGGVPCVWEDISDGFMCRRGAWIDQRGGPFPAPRVDYDFTTPSDADTGGNNTWYIWIRAQGGDPTSDPVARAQAVFWGLDVAGTDPTLAGIGDPNQYASFDGQWFKYNGADPGYWMWRRLQKGATGSEGDSIPLQPDTEYTLHIWAGSAGFSIDQIIITNNSGALIDNATRNIPSNDRRTGQACDPCDVRFGGYPGGPGDEGPPNCDDPSLPEDQRYRYNNPIFDDEQPMASVTAATARFVRKLDIGRDQIGVIPYSTRANPVSELLCLKSHGAGCTENVIENTLISRLMDRQETFANGSTNMPDVLEESIKILSTDVPHNGRPDALPVVILITDGQPNTYDGLDTEHKNCYSGNLYPGGDDPAKECTLYMAMRAREQGVMIHTITLGAGADQALMQAVSDATGGLHYHAETVAVLNSIYDAIYQQMAALPAIALYHRESTDAPWQMYPLTQTEAAPFAITGKNITALSEWTLGPLPIQVSANPGGLPANRVATATVSAMVWQSYWSNQIWPAEGVSVTFIASSGTITPVTALTANGVATATLTADSSTAPIIITATAENQVWASVLLGRYTKFIYLPLVLRQ
ncbi:MAG: VWA domain-containing protein [Anaerolineae bacterium]|nr:VWA domain-containing protein [Anaerolineae bacterium]